MNLKNTPIAALTWASLLGSASLSQAELLVSEDFSYGDGGLNGQNGGTGFSAAWNSSNDVSAGVAVGNSPSTRSLSTPFPSAGTLWISFDWAYSAQPTENGSYGGLTFYVGGSEKFLIGNTWPGSGHNFWRMNGSGSSGVTNHGGMKTGVAKITLGAGATSTVELWVGPAGSPVDVSGPAMATATDRDLAGVNGLRIGGVDFGFSNPQNFDNLLIGTEMADVDAAVPPTLSGAWSNPAGGLWDTTGNWTGGIVATGNGSTADFNALDIPADTTVDLDSARTVGNLVFGDTDTASAAGWTLANNGNAANILTLSGATPTITVNALGGTKTATISAEVAGTAGLVKSGNGTLVLAGPLPYTGATTVNDGTLQVSGQPYFNLGRTTSIASGAVFELKDSNNTFTSLMPVSTITGTGTFRLSGNSTVNQDLNGITGTRLTIDLQSGGLIDLLDSSILTNGGWQVLNWTNNKASMNISGGASFDVWDGQSVFIDALTGAGAVQKNHPGNSPTLLTVGVDNGSGTFSGSIANAQNQIALVKTGTGTQTLSGPNTYTGNTTVQDGTLGIDPAGSLRFRPTTSGATNSLSGSATATLSYLGKVDLDLSAADTTDGNFWTLVDVVSFGTATLEPATVTSTLGAFSDGDNDGIWELPVTGAVWIFDEADGSLAYDVTATPYELWAASFDPAIGLPAEDDDNDGLTNQQEFAFGLLPNSGASVNPIAVPLDKTSGTFSYTRRSDSGLTYSVWFSDNLSSWTEDTDATEGAPVLNGDNETVEVTLSTLPGAPLPAKLFIQVRAD